jgi:type IV pilus biogenesis protein CpaD/CtpE
MKRVLTAVTMTLLVGCASRGDVMKDGIQGEFKSGRAPIQLAACIDRNADSFALGSFQSKVVDAGAEPIEVVIKNGAGHNAIVQIRSASSGSAAIFYLGGAAAVAPKGFVTVMTEGCE